MFKAAVPARRVAARRAEEGAKEGKMPTAQGGGGGAMVETPSTTAAVIEQGHRAAAGKANDGEIERILRLWGVGEAICFVGLVYTREGAGTRKPFLTLHMASTLCVLYN